MDTILNFINANHPIILFVYGLVFFTLGTTLILQSRSYSRLELARSFRWLAAFGIAHGIHEWGELFIPLQVLNTHSFNPQFLSIIQLFILAISFVFLFQFGFSLLETRATKPWLCYIPVTTFGIWLLIMFWLFVPNNIPFQDWHNTGNTLARYLLAAPGSLLAAYSLRKYSIEHIKPLGAPHITTNLRLAGLAFIVYAFVGGIIGPAVDFFPGNLINASTFSSYTEVHPYVFRSAIGLILAITIIRALEIFDLEFTRRIEQLEQQQILAAERERIARNLHDGAIQTIYTAGLLVDSSMCLLEPEHQVVQRLGRAVGAINDAIIDLRHSLTELHHTPTNESLTNALKSLVEDPGYLSLVNIQPDFKALDGIALPPLNIEHILAISREAFSNIIRHAHATKISFDTQVKSEFLQLNITDNGNGFPKNSNSGYGLRNMRDRARLLGGHLDISSAFNKGTTVSLTIPREQKL
ncbi:MAG: hypothetical protein ISR60_06515 [Anaerolineales bacterium]|nr:hypothetical protein [Anaerolineales bacterium]